MKGSKLLSAEELKLLLGYDEHTGVFTWLAPRKGVRRKRAGSVMSHGYVAIRINGVDYTAHRLAWLYVHGRWPNGCIDHVNGNRADNRIGNLRDVSQSVNMHNVYAPKSNNKSGYRGVSWHAQRGKYTARIKAGGVYRSLGLFATPEDASAAYQAAKRELHEGCSR